MSIHNSSCHTNDWLIVDFVLCFCIIKRLVVELRLNLTRELTQIYRMGRSKREGRRDGGEGGREGRRGYRGREGTPPVLRISTI